MRSVGSGSGVGSRGGGGGGAGTPLCAAAVCVQEERDVSGHKEIENKKINKLGNVSYLFE